MDMQYIYKTNAAIAYFCKKFLRANIAFGILKIQKLLWYTQIYSFAISQQSFIFGNLQFFAGTYGPLNQETWLEWRGLLNSNHFNIFKLQKKIKTITINKYLNCTTKKQLDYIFYLKKNHSSWTLAKETQQHEPYIQARILANNGIHRILAQTFTAELQIGPIDNMMLKKYAVCIAKKFLCF